MKHLKIIPSLYVGRLTTMVLDVGRPLIYWHMSTLYSIVFVLRGLFAPGHFHKFIHF